MAMSLTDIESNLRAAFDGAEIKIEAMGESGESYKVLVAAKEFEGTNRVQQHRMVYDALGGAMAGDLHALAVETKVYQDEYTGENILETIGEKVNGHDIVLFMKGSRQVPQCGFSSTVCQVLERLGIEDYQDINVLDNQDIREGVKKFSNWPTIPQLYVKGEFVGGADIVREMYMSGELKQLFDNKGVATAA